LLQIRGIADIAVIARHRRHLKINPLPRMTLISRIFTDPAKPFNREFA
jgi:hypothetical protein